jgi:hypothetical protein
VQHEVDAGEAGRQQVLADSNAACASGIFEAHRLPPERNGTPRRRASAAMEYSTSAGSGVPKVGAPDCIEIEEAKLPSTTGAPRIDQLHERHARPAPRPASAPRCRRP